MKKARRYFTPFLATMLVGFAISCSSAKVDREPADLVPGTTSASKSLEERLRIGIDARLKAGLGFGYAAAVRQNGRTTEFAVGNRALEPVKPLTKKDLLEIGSISKTFTGILVQLAELEGRLTIDGKIEDVFPVLKGSPNGSLTIRELGLHESGLPSWPAGIPEKDPENPWHGLRDADVLAALKNFRRPALPEGQAKYKREYSNWGYLTLGLVLEEVYGRPYAEIVRKRLFVPLKMTSSGIDRATKKRKKSVPMIAPGYSLAADPVAGWDFDGAAAAVGGIESNVVDMAKFLEALENPPRGRLGEAIRATFRTGIGWDSAPGNLRPVWKNGMTGGYASFIAFYPETNSGVFVITNTSVSVDELGDFTTEVSPTDKLLRRVTNVRTSADEEIRRLKGKYRNPKPEADPALPLRSIEIFETLGKIVARYDFGFVRLGALLSSHEKPDTWNVTDGLSNVDAIRIIDGGVRATVTTTSGKTVTFELEKLASELQMFPAFEK